MPRRWQDDGTDFVNPPVAGGELPTSRTMIFVSPDGERSMNTYLGISAELGPDDVPEDVAAETEILFLEGYLFDKDKGKDAFLTRRPQPAALPVARRASPCRTRSASNGTARISCG